MSGVKEKPLHRRATPENAPQHCRQCRAPFVAAEWPRSKWTMTGWSPWCPECDKQHAKRPLRRAKSGPKPKLRGVAVARWTNMPS